jgi:hypothetical protein
MPAVVAQEDSVKGIAEGRRGDRRPAIDLMALVIIVIDTNEAFIMGLRTMLFGASGHEQMSAWLRHGRWLVAGLTFQLAADMIETAIAPTRQAIGRLADRRDPHASRLLLERDLAEVRERQNERSEAATTGK